MFNLFAGLRLTGFCVTIAALAHSAPLCREIPEGTHLRIRLGTSLSSYGSRAGTPVEAVLVAPVECEGATVLPAGAHVDGVVSRVRRVGLGIRHESALMEISFQSADTPWSPAVPLDARVVEVENAREVVQHGVIHGIRIDGLPQGRASTNVLHLPKFNPYAGPVTLAFKAGFPYFPEPEISFPAGTDFVLKLESAIPIPQAWLAEHSGRKTENMDAAEMNRIAWAQPLRTTLRDGKTPGDFINLIFAGSREQIREAFLAAGWSESEGVSCRSIYRDFRAVVESSAYGAAPMSTLLLGGRRPDMSWQRSLNSFGKRDHLRIWRTESTLHGEPVWVSAATRDVSADFLLRKMRFTHKIDGNIDEERARVAEDLTLAGCVDRRQLAPRNGVPRFSTNAGGGLMETDGAVAFVVLSDCPEAVKSEGPERDVLLLRPVSPIARLFRREILMLRNELLRANMLYASYDLLRMAYVGIRDRRRRAETSEAVLLARKAMGSGDSVAAGR